MKKESENCEEKYEIVIKKLGRHDPLEINIMSERQIQEVLMTIGKLNLRGAWGS